MQNDYFTKLLGIQGFVVQRITIDRQKGRSCAILDLTREAQMFLCGGCGQRAEKAIAYRERVVQHLSLWQHISYLRVMQYRVICPRCGLKVEKLPFIQRYSRVTEALGSLVYELCKVMTNKSVAILQDLDEEAVKNIDKTRLQEAQENRPLEGISALGVDEISVGKGHHYWHLVSAMNGPQGPELIYIGEGRREENLSGFWKWFGHHKTKQIKIAVMDMWKGFINSFKAHCPGIVILYDKFHVIRHLLDALNKVRKQELRCVNQRIKKALLAGKKFILLSRLSHIRGKARESLKELLSASPRLCKAHLLKESFSHLWSYKSKTWARKFWRAWKDSLKWTRLKPYRRFAKMIDRHLEGILSYCDHKLSLGFIEAVNLKARNIIRRAYGYRDKEYMKLKIIQACSSLGVFQPWICSFNITD